MSGGKVRRQASPSPQTWKEANTSQTEPESDRPLNQPACSFTDEGTGSKRQGAYFQAAVYQVFPSWLSGEKPQSTFSRPTSFSMKLLSEPTLIALDRKGGLTVILHPLGDG